MPGKSRKHFISGMQQQQVVEEEDNMHCTSLKILLMAFVLNFSLAHAALADEHKYHTGILQSLSNNQAVLSGRIFVLIPTVQVVVKAKKKGAYYEQRGSLSDVQPGDRVYLKATGNMVTEIVVMR
jgi:hypothetical protein